MYIYTYLSKNLISEMAIINRATHTDAKHKSFHIERKHFQKCHLHPIIFNIPEFQTQHVMDNRITHLIGAQSGPQPKFTVGLKQANVLKSFN